MENKELNFETRSIHSGFKPDEVTGATTVPIYQTASFEYESAQEHSDVFYGRKYGHQYSRVTNPSIEAFENRITAMHNGRGTVAVGSGMAAITTALFALTGAGDEIVSSKSLFGGTYYLYRHVLENFGVKINFVNGNDLEAYKKAITDKTKLIYLEVIGNPKLDIPNIAEISKIAKKANVPLVVDTTSIGPYLFDAKKFGVDVAVMSVTKYMSGSGTTIAGALVDLGNFDWKNTRSGRVKEATLKYGDLGFLGRCRRQIISNTGSILSPMNAFMASLGFDTLALRMEKHCSNALVLAEWFQKHPKITRVNYPGLESNQDHSVAKLQFDAKYGGLITIQVGSKENAYTVIDETKIARTLVNIGDTKTLVVHPRSTIYRDLTDDEANDAGVHTDLIRISVGLEHIDDLKADFDQALNKIKG